MTPRPALDLPPPGPPLVERPAVELAELADDTAAYVGGFEAYVRDQGGRLARIAFLLTGDVHLAEDLVQTALSRLAPRWDRVTAQGHPTPYVRAILVNTATGWRRRRWTGEAPTSPLPDGRADDGPRALADGVDRRDELRRALGQLGARQRAVVVLRFYEDLPEAEVARLLHCSVGTVKSQAAKALAKLRVLIPDDPGGDRDQ
jgi:RNA polymerase sigma-70 factor (sigma-E family)